MKKSLTTLCILGLGMAAQAMPAYPGKIRMTQPDGSVAEVTLRGDEHCHWVEGPDGMIGAPVRKAPASWQTQVDGTFPSTGQHKLLMLLVNFSDTQPKYAQSDFDRYMNEPNYGGIGSFRDFYLDNSYGTLDITTTVTRWITLPYPKLYYGDAQVTSLIAEALSQISKEIDLKQFDNDGDGILDGLAIIHQGAGQEATGNTSDIWSHSASLYNMEFGGVKVRRYTIQPEILGTTGGMSTIGVMCHEFGHNLGAPDFYDTDYANSGGEYPGTGVWDIMGSGAWNGNYGDRPTSFNMWQKIQLGWVKPTVLTESQSIAGVKPGEAFRFDTTTPGEYFILENRQKEGWDQTLPGHGLIAYHVSEELIDRYIAGNTLNVTYPQAVYTVCASSSYEPADHAASYGFVNSDSAPFPGANGVTDFSDRTTPSTRAISGRYTYKALSAIAEDTDGLISFNFTAEETPAAPTNLAAQTANGRVTLTWDVPTGAKNFTIYRNGAKIATVSGSHYTDRDTDGLSLVTYAVDATYASGLTSPYASVTLRVPVNPITALTCSSEGVLAWTVSDRITRMSGDDALQQTDYSATTLEYMHRFRREDLQTLRGYKIRRIGFLPVQSPQEVTITLRVYADGEPVSERVLKEFGAGVWNNTLLTKAVEITGDKELWIGLEIKSPSGVVRTVSDKGPAVESYGNWMRINGGEWQADTRQSGNFYLYAQLAAASTELEVPTLASEPDMELDMLFPIGFQVERDGEVIATCGGNTFTDNAPEGHHTYAVSALYRGDNLSAPVTIDADLSSINEIAMPKAEIYYDLQGRRVAHPASGIYIKNGKVVIYRD